MSQRQFSIWYPVTRNHHTPPPPGLRYPGGRTALIPNAPLAFSLRLRASSCCLFRLAPYSSTCSFPFSARRRLSWREYTTSTSAASISCSISATTRACRSTLNWAIAACFLLSLLSWTLLWYSLSSPAVRRTAVRCPAHASGLLSIPQVRPRSPTVLLGVARKSIIARDVTGFTTRLRMPLDRSSVFWMSRATTSRTDVAPAELRAVCGAEEGYHRPACLPCMYGLPLSSKRTVECPNFSSS
mmetsp:Transcript_15845/g.49795  ORF Transcript_15845/g.49795 Transcript_15845/m.49795 type:complete len:242 (-) Transcript_15845:143-868(-)